MGNIVGKLFKVVASKNVTDSLADSVKEGNQSKFYLAQAPSAASVSIDGLSLDDVIAPNKEFDRNVLIINGNKIQGVNDSDITKLNAIRDVTNLFVYKGSVDKFADLPTTNVKVGDVYNVNREFNIGDVSYPAYTNVVCSYSKAGAGQQFITWDALGGTMQMGTIAKVTADQNHTLIFAGNNDVPINSFQINVATERGLVFDEEKRLSLQYIDPIPTKIGNIVTYYASDTEGNLKPMRSLSLSEGTGIALSTKNNNSVEISAKSTFADDMTVVSKTTPKTVISLSSNGELLKEVRFSIGSGLRMENSHGDALKGITLSLATGDYSSTSTRETRGCGIDINANGEMYIAISSFLDNSSGENYVPALQLVDFNADQKQTGGLAINGVSLLKWLTQNNGFNYYINSLIDAKLKAQ